jgi:hypothetical protein
MNRTARLSSPWLSILGTAFVVGSSLAFNAGCGALGAAANPRLAWAVTDPAPMSVVVRRADAATATSKEVDRLLTATPANPDSDWLANIGPSSDDAKANAKTVGDLPAYKQSKARVVPSEVWIRTLPNLHCDSGQYPSLLAFVDPTLADAYTKIMAKKQEVADLKAEEAEEDEAASAKDVSDADKKTHKDKSAAIDKQVDAAEDAIGPMEKDFVKSAKAKAGAASPDMKAKLGGAFVNLRKAVDDAQIANGAAAVRYPMAIPGIQGAVKTQVTSIVGDILEEKTGKRPNLASLQAGLTFNGSGVDVTLNGIASSDLGSLSMGDLTTETVKRTKDWMGHAIGLLGDISKNKEILSYEADVLDAVLDGFKSGGWSAPTAVAFDTSGAGSGSGSLSISASASGSASAANAANAKTAAAATTTTSATATTGAAGKLKTPQAKKTQAAKKKIGQ